MCMHGVALLQSRLQTLFNPKPPLLWLSTLRPCTMSRMPLRMASYSISSHAIRCLNVSKNSDEGCRMHSLLGKLRLTGAVAQHAHDVAARARVRCWCNTYNATTSACGYVPPFTSLTLVFIQLQYRLQAK